VSYASVAYALSFQDVVVVAMVNRGCGHVMVVEKHIQRGEDTMVMLL
jgi:hypothetical protein